MYRNYQKPGVFVQQDGTKPLILPLWLCDMDWFPVWWGKSVAAGRHIAIRLLWRLGVGLGRLNTSSEDTGMALCMVISITHYVVSKTPFGWRSGGYTQSTLLLFAARQSVDHAVFIMGQLPTWRLTLKESNSLSKQCALSHGLPWWILTER